MLLYMISVPNMCFYKEEVKVCFNTVLIVEINKEIYGLHTIP